MRFLKRNKTIIISLVVFFILILLCVKIKNILFPNEGVAAYGNRLDGYVELRDNTDDIIKKLLTEDVSKVKVKTTGKILNITLTLGDNTSRDSAKAYAKKALEGLTKEELAYYDIQFYLIKTIETTDFPIIGYKIPTAENITWTKDR